MVSSVAVMGSPHGFLVFANIRYHVLDPLPSFYLLSVSGK